MLKAISRILLRWWGFRWTGPDPERIPQKVYAVYPHTSNWDFLLGMLLKWGMPIHVNYVAKDALFKWPYGWIFRKLGGIPVDRSKSTHFVNNMAAQFKKYPRLAFAIAPEGTRKRVRKFKTGFYYIALEAGVPIILVKFDFGNKVADFSEPLYPSGDYKKDMKTIVAHFTGTAGKNPELACQWEDEVINETE